jgi:hypothetical protein
VLLLVTLSAGLVGCSSPEAAVTPTPTVPALWYSYISTILASNPSDFEREVLADFKVTDAEYAEAQDRYISCMADHGWVVTADANGYSGWGAVGTPNEGQPMDWTTSAACENGTITEVEPVYVGMTRNPEGLSRAELVRTCFAEHNVPDGDGLSDDELETLLASIDYHPSTPEGKLCRWDPNGTAGISLALAEEMDANMVG